MQALILQTKPGSRITLTSELGKSCWAPFLKIKILPPEIYAETRKPLAYPPKQANDRKSNFGSAEMILKV